MPIAHTHINLADVEDPAPANGFGDRWEARVAREALGAQQTGVGRRHLRQADARRSLRLDPGDSDKLASNWDVVCVAPTLGRGHADYGRFVRRHSHLHAPLRGRHHRGRAWGASRAPGSARSRATSSCMLNG